MWYMYNCICILHVFLMTSWTNEQCQLCRLNILLWVNDMKIMRPKMGATASGEHGKQKWETVKSNITRSLSCCVSSSPKFTRYALWSLDSQQTYHVGQGAYNSCESCTYRSGLAMVSLFLESSPVITKSLSDIVTYDVTLIVTSMSREPVFFSVTWDRARLAQPRQQLQCLERETGLARAVRCVHPASPARLSKITRYQ